MTYSDRVTISAGRIGSGRVASGRVYCQKLDHC